jgi:phosphoglycolate phosphatase-like HAD superfamily hydrolase
MRRVAVFDVDGTLTQSSECDDCMFARTAQELLGITQISLDWSTYPHSTDDSIAAHLIGQAQGRRATRLEVDEFQEHALTVLRQELERRGGVKPVSGALRVLELVRHAGWEPAIATGCWRKSALLKLASAGISIHGLAAAFADDAWPREEIIGRAVQRALALAGETAGDAATQSTAGVVYSGDGIWDVRACRRSGYRFVGIAQGPRAAALRQEGAGTVLAGYADLHAFLEALENASIPRSA